MTPDVTRALDLIERLRKPIPLVCLPVDPPEHEKTKNHLLLEMLEAERMEAAGRLEQLESAIDRIWNLLEPGKPFLKDHVLTRANIASVIMSVQPNNPSRDTTP